uniref:SWIM-type domain-containing protein n=1 Tax=Lactuca sativa TaxID=4236 RepID=A0A9R1UVJ6_LACSA|nr:hypothetical protein LSAT_V11C800421030 [Lactuca sativa]
MEASNGKYLTIDFHFNGMFAPSPLVYLDPMRMSVRDVDFSGMDYREFVLWVSKLTRRSCENLYYCSTHERLAEGIRRIESDADYFEFIEDGYMDKQELRMNVYIDHENEPILDWADKELLTGDELSDVIEDDDTESQISDIRECEHEPDEEVHTFDKTYDDEFLSKLCGKPILNSNQEEVNDVDDDEDSDKDDEVVFPAFDEKQQWDKMVPVLGMKFANPLELKLCLTNYAVKNGYDLWFEKNDHQKLLAKCCKYKKNKKSKSCPFRLWATWMKNERSFQIKSLIDRHNCARVFKFGSIVSYKWIGTHFMNDILQKRKMSIRKLKAKVSKRFNLIASVGQCRNARKYAFHQIEGTLIEHYAKTWSYGEELKRTNPGSTVKMEVDVMPDGETYFSKFYVCLKGLKDGWMEGCRRVIGVDGCFLKGICRGQLLAAIGRDANNHIYPVAWAVVAVENKESWKWFLDLLIDDIGMGVGHGLTIISDQHKGLVEAVKERVPAAEHRQCARHICANLQKRFKGQIFKKLFWRAAGSTVDRSCDAYENGVSESFNSVIEAARKKPLITMLEEIRIYVMERLCIYKAKGQSWDLNICPSIRLKLNKHKETQRFWQVVPSGYMQFEVRVGTEGYAVDLNTRQCGCRAWQLAGYPCVHGYAAISSLNRDPEEYVSEWFTTSMYASCYRYNIRPLNCSAMWPEVDYTKPLPPKKRRLPGRPTMKRKRDQVEREAKGTRHTVSKKGMIMRCTICRERGHNRSTCPLRPNDVPSTSGSNKKKPKKQGMVLNYVIYYICVPFLNFFPFTGKVDLEAELEMEHVVMFESESDSDFESESDVEANVPEVEVDVPFVQDNLVWEIQDDIQVDTNIEVDVPEVDLVPEVEVDANIEDEIQANIEVEHEIEVQDNVEQEIQHNAENQVRKRTRKTSERITKIQIRKNIRRKEGSSADHPLEI